MLDHAVVFYEREDALVDAVTAQLAPALAAGDVVLVIATPEHREAFAAALDGAGAGPLVLLDAADLLATFMVDGSPDAALFRANVGKLVAEAAAGSQRVSAYGEMVALLWAEGNVQAAIDLEDLWNDLGRELRFSLLCAYPASAFDRGVCLQHTKVVTSVDERVALEHKQRELEGALDRLQEIDRIRNQFVAMVVHDIRGPANIIASFLDLLRENWAVLDDEQITDFLERGLANTRHIGRLVDDMLTVARIDSGEFTYKLAPVDLTGLVHRVASEMRVETECDIDTTRVAAVPMARADEARQVQILNNLLSNAVKFSADEIFVSLTTADDGREVVVSVTDRGVGIAPGDLGEVFEPFSRLRLPRNRQVKGTGLGLYIAKALIEGQGGAVSVESKVGVGSTFSYTVPVAGR